MLACRRPRAKGWRRRNLTWPGVHRWLELGRVERARRALQSLVILVGGVGLVGDGKVVLRVDALEAAPLASLFDEFLRPGELEQDEKQQPGADANDVHTAADGHAHAGRDPQSGGRRQAD